MLLKACKFIQRKEVVEALVYFGMMEEGEGVPVGGGAEAACLPSAGGVSVCWTVFMMCVCGSCMCCHTTMHLVSFPDRLSSVCIASSIKRSVLRLVGSGTETNNHSAFHYL